jgi:hypothetical protein
LHALRSHTQQLPRALAAGAGLALLLLAAGAAASARQVHAAPTTTVDTLADGHLDGGATTCVSTAAGGKCTLRAAIELNEANGGGASIVLGQVGTGQIMLTLGQLTIEHDVTITGGGVAKNAVTGDGSHRVFDIFARDINVAMSGFAIIGGRAETAPGAVGGGIRNFGNLTLTGVMVTASVAGFGGGIADFGTLALNAGAIITMNQVHIVTEPNTVTDGGVGAGVAEFGKLVANGALFSANTASDAGGNLAVDFVVNQAGQIIQRGTAAVTNTTLDTGTAIVGGGAWLDIVDSATFTASTFSLNAARVPAGTLNTAAGAAIESECGALTLVNVTLSGNHADNGFGGGIAQECGGIDVARTAATTRSFAHKAAPVTIDEAPAGRTAAAVTPSPTPPPLRATAMLDFVTMAGNTAADGAGSGIANAGENSTITIHDTIVANHSGKGVNCLTIGNVTTTSQGYNLEDANDCGFNKTGDQTGANPQLGALAANGGPTETMALKAGTPPVDTADPNCAGRVTTDQRGITRPQGSRCDIGAFELQVATPATPTPLPSPPVTGHGPSPFGPAFLALVLALLLIPAVGAGLLIARRRSA